jgi:hypothetical protein
MAVYVTLPDLDLSTTPAQFTDDATPCVEVAVKSLISNAAVVRVGDDDVAADQGWPLSPGESITLRTSDASKIWLVAESGTPTVARLIAKGGT